VVDITNPVNETFDALVVPSDSSATQELAQLVPGANLVKAFNTTFATTLRGGEVAGQPLDVLIAGDDDGAKGQVATLARDGGLNPIDAGSARPGARARGARAPAHAIAAAARNRLPERGEDPGVISRKLRVGEHHHGAALIGR
jgi:predicted dinucleotide-binding enzyme